jgi:multiple sugar transport system substrate-binding protein
VGEREKIAEGLLMRELSRRGLLKAGALTAGAAFVAACGGAVQPSPTAGPGASPTPGTATPGATGAPPDENFAGVTLRVAGSNTMGPPAEEAGKKWAARTGGEVIVERLSGAERRLKFASTIAAQDPIYDVLYSGHTFIAQFGDRIYEDLGQYNIDTTDFIPAILPHLSHQGRLMGLPVHSEQEIFIYNKTMFERAGADPDNLPTTWNEIYELAPKLREGQPSSFTTCAVPWLAPFAEIWWLVYFNATGGTFLSDDRIQFLGGGANGLKTWQAIKDGFDSGFYDAAGAAIPGDYETGLAFNAGLAACQINVAELWAQAVSGSDEFDVKIRADEVGVTINPGIDSSVRSGGGNAAEGYGISKFSQQKEAALSYLKEITGPEYQKEMILNIGLPGARISVLNDPEIVEKFAVGQVLAEQGQYANSRYPAPYNWTPVITEGLTGIISGGWSAAQANEHMEKGMEDAILKYLSGA